MMEQDFAVTMICFSVLCAPAVLGGFQSKRSLTWCFNALSAVCVGIAYHYPYHPMVYLPMLMLAVTSWLFAVGFAINQP
ncbi:hypothetical protein [Vibrio nomapromontoriensis]|uniref:hypothetical protein n=1 Tax=Vibrio nomapromontoriensis TaxID=2910246 RepID=UPI003D117994